MKMKLLALAPAVVLALAGCGAQSPPAAQPTPSAANTLSAFDACDELMQAVSAALDGATAASATQMVAAADQIDGLAPRMPATLTVPATRFAAELRNPLTDDEMVANAAQPILTECQSVVDAESALQGVTPDQPAQPGVIGDGKWIIGEDMAAGTWKTTAHVVDGCYWAILKAGTNGTDIIANDNAAGGFARVTVKRGQEFETSDCGEWTKS